MPKINSRTAIAEPFKNRARPRRHYEQIPTSRSGKNEGWLKSLQSYHNNSIDWWLERFHSAFPKVHVFDSAWNDKISVGKWFICSD
jgi:hypothetical protein